jgi:hypothetical protein
MRGSTPASSCALRGGCCTNPRPARWIRFKAGFRKRPTRSSRATCSSPRRPAQHLWNAPQRAGSTVSEPALCNSHREGSRRNALRETPHDSSYRHDWSRQERHAMALASLICRCHSSGPGRFLRLRQRSRSWTSARAIAEQPFTIDTTTATSNTSISLTPRAESLCAGSRPTTGRRDTSSRVASRSPRRARG